VKRWILKFELTHKFSFIQQLFLFSSTWTVFPGAGFMYILGLVMTLTLEECPVNIFLCFEL